MKTAVCQFTATPDIEANLDTCAKLIAQAAQAGARLAVLPEAVMFFDPDKTAGPGPHGQSLDGAFVTELGNRARKAGVAVVAGVYEPSDDGRDYNTLVAISASGELLGTYRKIHLYDAFGYRESDKVRAGDIGQPLIFQVDGVTIGALTCYDLRFPEAFRWLAEAGAEAIVLPAAWAVGPMKEDHWLTLAKARAIENTVYLAAAGQTGPDSCGQSSIIDPMGVVLASAGEVPGSIATADILTERVAHVRTTNPSLSNRRFTVAPATQASRLPSYAEATA
jgi:predicted amidohydrolase